MGIGQQEIVVSWGKRMEAKREDNWGGNESNFCEQEG